MRKGIITLACLLAGIHLASAWTYEIQNQDILKLAATRNGELLIQMLPGIHLSDRDLGDRCVGGWMWLSNATMLDLAKTLSQSHKPAARVIFSSVDVGVGVQGNPDARTYCAVDWLEGD